MRIRQSLLGSFDACPRRFQYSLESPPDVYHSGIVRAVGTAYHAGLEYYYMTTLVGRADHPSLAEVQDMARSTLLDEIERAGENFIWDDKFPLVDDADECIGSMLMHYFEDGHAWPSDWEVLGVEEKFTLPYFNYELAGTIDLVLRDPNGWICGVDHKTAGRRWDQYKHHPRKNNQAPFYVGALAELYPDAPGHRFVFDVMTYKGEFERRISDPTPAHVEAVKAKALQVAALYEGLRAAGMDLPVNPSSTLCSKRYCDWWSVCSSGAILDV